MCAEIGNVSSFLSQSVEQLTQKKADFHDKMKEVMNKEGGVTQEDLLALQFEMGQYTTLIETISSISKSMTDTLKSLAQKVG